MLQLALTRLLQEPTPELEQRLLVLVRAAARARLQPHRLLAQFLALLSFLFLAEAALGFLLLAVLWGVLSPPLLAILSELGPLVP